MISNFFLKVIIFVSSLRNLSFRAIYLNPESKNIVQNGTQDYPYQSLNQTITNIKNNKDIIFQNKKSILNQKISIINEEFRLSSVNKQYEIEILNENSSFQLNKSNITFENLTFLFNSSLSNKILFSIENNSTLKIQVNFKILI